jgi:hypothetical protein
MVRRLRHWPVVWPGAIPSVVWYVVRVLNAIPYGACIKFPYADVVALQTPWHMAFGFRHL